MSGGIRSIKVIKPGLLVRSETGVILDARSTVTLIQSEKNNILVDTSLKKDRESLLFGLQEQNLTPKDINIVINTHGHRDHVENNVLFSSAKIYVHHLNKLRGKCVKVKSFPYYLEKDIKIIETPGHSWDSISIIVKFDLIYALTGDAIPIKNNYFEWIPPIVHVDANRALESMKQIVQLADIIIPGHEPPFRIEKSFIQ